MTTSMKNKNSQRLFLILIVLCLYSAIAQAKTEAISTWISGSDTIYNYGFYGTKGVPDPANIPGARRGSISWIDISGNLLLFGGAGHGSAGHNGWLNDLWKYDGENWTWVSGSDTRNNNSIYGTKGIADPANTPGAREESISWTDSEGNLWLFGGHVHGSSSRDRFNDLWKFDGTNWTWVSGSDTRNNSGVYGTMGVANPNNVPGARSESISWVDSSGNLWLFGGDGYPSAEHPGELNDLWKYDGTNWTWVSGSNTRHSNGVYGTKGVAESANVPGARSGSVSWIDSENNLWLFGGCGRDRSGLHSRLNDLWKYDGENWTWVNGSDAVNSKGIYGTKGVAGSANIPGARHWSTSWTDSMGNFWLFGGHGRDSANGSSDLNDLWKYDGENWTWVSGSDAVRSNGVYGTKGVADPANIPGARGYSISWTDNTGNLWLFGGSGLASMRTSGRLNDLWKFDGTNWTWVSGSDTICHTFGVYGTKELPNSTNILGARGASVSWIDSSYNLWIFGGYGFDSSGVSSRLNDLWKYDGENWTWVSGSDIRNNSSVYGTKGVADSANMPGARYGSVSWADIADNLWLFGGYGYASTNNSGWLNDLWKFDGENWTWVSGSDMRDKRGVYGTKGIADPANTPGSRNDSISWTDSKGNFWLFGGDGYDIAGRNSYLNDLWKFDGENWTWVSGDNTIQNKGVYGTKGVGDPANNPGAREGSVSWIDSDDNLWLFAGYGFDGSGGGGRLNDLWKFDSENWTWVSGGDTINNKGVYGIKGVADPNNIPGSRYESISWADSVGNFWVFGGSGFVSTSDPGLLNDLWKFDGINWIWVNGADTIGNIGVYGTKGAGDPANNPGARKDSISWTDSAGDLCLFGGIGYDSIGGNSILNDLWNIQTYEFVPNTPPVADAGDAIITYAGVNGLAMVKLDGSGSFDSDGDLLEYFWFNDANELIAEGVDPNVILTAGEHVIELIVNDGIEDSEPNEVVITVIEPVEADLYITPRVINRNSRGRSVMAIITLPEGIGKDDIDGEFILLPGEIAAERQLVREVETIVKVFALFSRSDLMDAIAVNSLVELTVVGRLKSGQCIYGRDSVRIVEPKVQRLRRRRRR